MTEIIVYISSVSGNLAIKKKQQAIMDVLESKRVPFKSIDIASDEKARDHMRKTSGKSIIPQIFVDGKFKGSYEEYSEANEDGRLNDFFGVTQF